MKETGFFFIPNQFVSEILQDDPEYERLTHQMLNCHFHIIIH